MHSPPLIIDSDNEACSLSSSVCEDYFNNLVDSGLEIPSPDENEALDLAKGLPSTHTSPVIHPPPPPNQTIAPALTTPPPTSPPHNPAPTLPPPSTSHPPDTIPHRLPRSTSPTNDQPVESALSTLALMNPDTAPTAMPPTPSESSPQSAGPDTCSHASSPPAFTPSASPRRPPVGDGARKTWDLIEGQTVAAFRQFCDSPVKGASFTCVPMAAPKVRLAMHRAAEVLGCRSSSMGDGRERCVVLSWTKDGAFPIGEGAVVAAVHSVLEELFPWRDVEEGVLGRGEKKGKGLRRRERAMRRREKRLEDEAKIADLEVDPEVVEALVADMNWHALDRLYQGVRVPAIERKKRQARKRAKAMEREAMQMAAMGGRGAYAAGGDGSIGRYGGGVDGHGTGFQGMQGWNGMMDAGYPGGFVGYPRAGFGGTHDGMVGVGQGLEGGASGRQGVGGGKGGSLGRRSSTRAGSSGAHTALNGRPLEKSNKGFEMLEKMGWKKGDGLGSEREGRREPVVAEMRRHRAGLGG